LDKQSIWQWLDTAIQQQKLAALLIVVDCKGSSPGKTGAKLAITADNSSFGTIGGGMTEFDLCEYAKECLKQNQPKIQLINKWHHKASADNYSGQICGGEQSIVLVLLNQNDQPLLQKIIQAEENDQPITLEISPQELVLSSFIKNNTNSSFNFQQQSEWLYRCIIGLEKTAYIIGGGHVSLALTQLLVLLDFRVIVIEQRAGVKTMQDNTLANKKLISPYSEIANKVIDGDQHYVFVMTHSHETDQQVIELLAEKQFKYFGVLGSHRKISILRKNLKHKISEKAWQSIHAPIGLPINSHSPMEIAISIAAELVQLNNGPKIKPSL